MSRPPIEVDTAEAALRRWLERVEYRSYDPYDGLSNIPTSIVVRHPLAARVFMQAVKRSPVNVRPLLGIRPRVLAKSLSDIASASLWDYRLDGDREALARARQMLDRLGALACSGYAGACWALPTPYVTRFICSPGGDPNLFWTINVAVAFLEAYELERRPQDLQVARSAVEFILRDLGVVDEGEDGVWFRYFIGHPATVYNVAALGGALLQRVGHHVGGPDIISIGTRALRFVVRNQNADGSWFYARGPTGRWVDGFHTGYILEALLQSWMMHGDAEVGAALEKGMEFYLTHMFTPAGLPRYASNRTFPIEVQNCAQAIQTLSRLSWRRPELVGMAERTAQAVVRELFRWARHGESPEGYFMMSRGRWLTDATPSVRWGEAPMLLALISLRAAKRRLRPFWELAAAAV